MCLIIASSPKGFVPLLVSAGIGFHQPKIIVTSTVRSRKSCKDIVTIRSLLDRVGLIPVSTSKGFVPLLVSAGIGFHQPKITVTSTVRPRISSEDVVTVCGLLDRVCLFRASTSKGFVPLPVSAGICFHQPKITVTSTIRTRHPSKDVATVCGLQDRVCMFIASSAKCLIPFFFRRCSTCASNAYECQRCE